MVEEEGLISQWDPRGLLSCRLQRSEADAAQEEVSASAQLTLAGLFAARGDPCHREGNQVMQEGEKQLNCVTWAQTSNVLLGGSMHGPCGTLALPLESQCLQTKEFDCAEPTSSL